MKLLDYRGVADKLGVSPGAVPRLVKDPSFPKRTNILGPRSSRWVEEEVDEWIIKFRSQENGSRDQA